MNYEVDSLDYLSPNALKDLLHTIYLSYVDTPDGNPETFMDLVESHLISQGVLEDDIQSAYAIYYKGCI